MATDPFATNPGNPIGEFEGFDLVLVWDDYHGFVVAKRDPLTDKWKTDLPYAFESGGKEIEIEPVLWWPLPSVPEHVRG